MKIVLEVVQNKDDEIYKEEKELLSNPKVKALSFFTTLSSLSRRTGIKEINEIENLLLEIRDEPVFFIHKESKLAASVILEIDVKKTKKDSLEIIYSKSLALELIENDNYKNMTVLDIYDLAKMKVAHSLTLYENLLSTMYDKSFQNKNYNEDELRNVLGLQDEYSESKQFTRLIKKCISDINKNSNKVSIELLKIVRPMTKANPTPNRIYKFKTIKTFSSYVDLNKFKKFMRTEVSNQRVLKYKFGPHLYYYVKEIETGLNKWFKSKSLEKTTTKISDKIWDAMYKEFLEDTEIFLDSYKVEIGRFVEWRESN